MRSLAHPLRIPWALNGAANGSRAPRPDLLPSASSAWADDECGINECCNDSLEQFSTLPPQCAAAAAAPGDMDLQYRGESLRGRVGASTATTTEDDGVHYTVTGRAPCYSYVNPALRSAPGPKRVACRSPPSLAIPVSPPRPPPPPPPPLPGCPPPFRRHLRTKSWIRTWRRQAGRQSGRPEWKCNRLASPSPRNRPLHTTDTLCKRMHAPGRCSSAAGSKS